MSYIQRKIQSIGNDITKSGGTTMDVRKQKKGKKKTLPRVRPGRGNKQIAQGRGFQI